MQNHRQIPPPRLYRPRVPRQVPNHSDPRSLHPNIVQIHEAFDSDDSLTMVLNLCRVQDGCCQTIIYIYIYDFSTTSLSSSEDSVSSLIALLLASEVVER
ncbi:hypothetical protein LINPERHAP1_LOCUS8390 [Linum perenne]